MLTLYNFNVDTTVIHMSVSSFQTVTIGSSAVIECNITLNTAIGPDLSVLNYYWYHDNNMLKQGPSLQIINRKTYSKLEINPFKASNAGIYQCSACIVGSNTITSNTTQLCVKGIIILIHLSTSLFSL